MAIFHLPRLQRLIKIVDKEGQPEGSFQIWWDQFAKQIEGQETTQDVLLLQIVEALATMSDIADVTVTADYTGAVDAGQLPRSVQANRYSGSTNQNTLAAWSFTVDSGGLTATIANGLLDITAVSATSVVTVTSAYSGVTRSKAFTVTKQIAAPPATGSGGGTSATDTTFTTFNSTTHAAVSDELTVTVASSGTVMLSAPLSFGPNTVVAGTWHIYSKWQWYDTGTATWTDVAAEVISSVSASIASSPYSYRIGAISIPTSKTGLVAASSQKFRLMARNNTGTQTMKLAGTASAVSS